MKNFYKLERKLGRLAIPNLMMLLVFVMLSIYVVDLLFPQISIGSWISLNRYLIMQGQVWRLITFVFAPPISSPIFVVFVLYFNYFIGSTLESQWGTFSFNLYYFIGTVATIAGAMITGYADNTYLNMSLFFAFAVLFPNFEARLFFILPVKMKYLAYIDALFFVIAFFTEGTATKVSILFSLVNFFLFFGGDIIKQIKDKKYYRKNQAKFKNFYR